MAEHLLEEELEALAKLVGFPETPALERAVIARIEAEREGSILRRAPRVPTMSRRRLVILIAVALSLVAGVAVASRLGVGAFRIHVGPTRTPAPSVQVERGVALGRPVTLAAAQAMVDFPIRVPASIGPADQVFVSRTIDGDRMVALAWRPDASLPRVPRADWGLVLMELPGDQALAVKDLGPGNVLEAADVDGAPGYWMTGPHDLILRRRSGIQTLRVTGNVLLWQVGDVSFRLESALTEPGAIQLARTIG